VPPQGTIVFMVSAYRDRLVPQRSAGPARAPVPSGDRFHGYRGPVV